MQCTSVPCYAIKCNELYVCVHHQLQVSTAREVLAAADVPGAAQQLQEQVVPAVEQVGRVSLGLGWSGCVDHLTCLQGTMCLLVHTLPQALAHRPGGAAS